MDTRLSELKGNVGPCQRYALYSAILVIIIIIIIIIMTSVKNRRPSVNLVKFVVCMTLSLLWTRLKMTLG